MINTTTLDKNYSTTQLLTQEKPILERQPEDKFESVLFLPEGEGRKGEGGLRTKGYFKKSYENKPLISIITVVFNGEKYLEQTIQNVINQSYDNVEYIIIDGGSTDGTLDIIKKYEDQIDYWISEKDRGIYDAMNKSIDLASGEWINFMNAGDWFYTDNVLKDIFDKSNFFNIDIIYGDNQVVYPNKKRIAKAGNMEDIWKGSQFSHQSTFVSSSLHKKNKFNIFNRIGADFQFFYNAYKNETKFKYINTTIATISSGGLSDIKRIDSIVGRWNVIEKNEKTNSYYIWIISKEMIKERIKRLLNK